MRAAIQYDRFLDCVHCGLCTAACPTYVETGNENDSPRGRIYLMRAVTDGRIELSPEVRRHLELCLDCRACETACPSGVQYGRLIEPFRVAMDRSPPCQGDTDGEARSDGPPPSEDNSTGSPPCEGGVGGGKSAPPYPVATSADWFHRWVLYRLFPYPRRTRAALAPLKLLRALGIDWLLGRVGFYRLLPRRLRQMHDMLPRRLRGGRRLPEVLPAQGKRRARVALFTGCVADAVFRGTHWATARVLQANGCEVHVPRGQVCCGAIHYHSGSPDCMGFMETNAAVFNPGQYDAVIVNVAGCGSMLKDYAHIAAELAPLDPAPLAPPLTKGGPGGVAPPEEQAHDRDGHFARLADFASNVRDVSEFLAELRPLPPKGEIRLRAAYHDACHLVHAQRVREQPRKLLEMIPGLELVPLEESELCCGAAGSYNLTEPEMSERLARRKLDRIEQTGADALFTANAGCIMQIERSARQRKMRLWVAHPMEVLDLSYRGAPPPVRK